MGVAGVHAEIRVRIMRWFRANKRYGGRLALLALAVQLVLSFGHIHREDIYGPARAASGAAAIALPAVADAQPLPTDHPSKHTDDYCAICATMSLLGSSFAAAPPQLPLPFESRAVEHADRVAVAVVAPRRAAFQSRAPPAA
jgi:hypothetical protein